jgi:hypothetical protein
MMFRLRCSWVNQIRRTPKYEKAAIRWLERYLTEGSPRLQHFAETLRVSPNASDLIVARLPTGWPRRPLVCRENQDRLLDAGRRTPWFARIAPKTHNPFLVESVADVKRRSRGSEQRT